MPKLLLPSALLLLALALACAGGGGSPAAAPPPAAKTWADTLVYTDPQGTGFRLVRNAALSTPTRLVLEVAGPAGQSGRGLAFLLGADAAKVTWVAPPGGTGLVQNLAFDLGTGVPALVGKDKGGGVLQGAAFQKAGSPSFGQPLVRVCLELKSGAVPVNAAVPLAFTSGNTLGGAGAVSPLALAVGGLVAQ